LPDLNPVIKSFYNILLYGLLIEKNTTQKIDIMLHKTGARERIPSNVIISALGKIRSNTVGRIPRLIPGLGRYKIGNDLERISELYSIFETLGIEYFICGGISLSVRLFNLNGSHYHSDVDLAILGKSISELSTLAKKKGWKVSEKDNIVTCRKKSTAVDIFIWDFLDTKHVRHKAGNTTITIPIQVFSYDTYDLWGMKHRIASIDYITETSPFILKKRSREMCRKLCCMTRQSDEPANQDTQLR